MAKLKIYSGSYCQKTLNDTMSLTNMKQSKKNSIGSPTEFFRIDWIASQSSYIPICIKDSKKVGELMKDVKMQKHFKANLTAVEGHWQHKVTAHQVTIKDAEKPRFCNDITIFIPKLTPEHTKPCVFFHLKNRSSRCYLRCSHPIELANKLEEIAMALRSDAWLEKWQRLEEVSERLIVDELLLDEDYIDIPLFNQNCNIEKDFCEQKPDRIVKQ